MAVFCNEIDFRFSQGVAAAAIKATTVNALSMIRTLFLNECGSAQVYSSTGGEASVRGFN